MHTITIRVSMQDAIGSYAGNDIDIEATRVKWLDAAARTILQAYGNTAVITKTDEATIAHNNSAVQTSWQAPKEVLDHINELIGISLTPDCWVDATHQGVPTTPPPDGYVYRSFEDGHDGRCRQDIDVAVPEDLMHRLDVQYNSADWDPFAAWRDIQDVVLIRCTPTTREDDGNWFPLNNFQQ